MMSDLLQELVDVHYECCKRENVSSHILLNTFIASGSSEKAIVAAISTFGNTHAPVAKVMPLFDLPDLQIKEGIKRNIQFGNKIAGFGSSFVKGRPDLLFQKLITFISRENQRPIHIARMVTDQLHELGINIFPNAAFWTAAAGYVLGYDANTIPFLLIQCRMSGWEDTIRTYTETGEIFYGQKA